MKQEMTMKSAEAIRVSKKRLAQAEKRLTELDRLFVRLYEDNVNTRISDERFVMISKLYEDEQQQLKADVLALQLEIDEQERQAENLNQFIQTIGQYTELQELTPYALRELVKAIYVEAP